MGLRQRFYRFMYGRYGLDELGRMMMYTSVFLLIVSSLLPFRPLYFLCLAVIGISYFRIFSKNVYKRSYENDRYIAFKCKVAGFFKKLFGRSGSSDGSYSSRCNCFKGERPDRNYKIFKCPDCKQKLRVPRGKGKIQITCRRCGKEFVKRT